MFEAEALAAATKPEHSGRIPACGCGMADRLLRDGAGVIRPGGVSVDADILDSCDAKESFAISQKWSMTEAGRLTSWSISCFVLMLFSFGSPRQTVQPFSVAGKQVICSCDDIANCLGGDQDRWTEFLNLNVGIRS
jgi:hypothetical protein